MLGIPYAEAGDGVVTTGIPGCDFVTGKLTAQCIPQFIGHLIAFAFGMVGAFFLINAMIGGYQIAIGAATGDKEAGKRRLFNAVIGLIVCILAYVILNLFITVVTGI